LTMVLLSSIFFPIAASMAALIQSGLASFSFSLSLSAYA
jgi:hypothetical protein